MKVDTDIPPPDPLREPWPFADMKIGDSFFVPKKDAKSLRSSAWAYGEKNPPFKYRARQQEENGVTGIRLWRVE